MAKATQETRHMAVATPLGDDALLIESFSGSEELSRLFSYELELIREGEPIAFEDLIGQNITIRLETGSAGTRHFNGYISKLSLGESDPKFTRYRATVVPWAWFLTRSADCRIFQDKSVPDIIKQVCEDHGFTDLNIELSGTYNPWVYCVQYRETAFDFISRLMEHEGIYYYFTHEDGKHTLCLCDSPTVHKPIPGDDDTLTLREPRAALTLRSVWDWTTSAELESGAFALNDFDFTATTKDLNAKAITSRTHPASKLEIFEHPGDYEQPGDGETYAKIRLQELEAQSIGVSAVSAAPTLSAGATFTLAEHPVESENKKYLITTAAYTFTNSSITAGAGGSSEPFRTRFTAMDAAVQYRPRRITPVPTIEGPQTAFVVGPSGEEIYTDEHGRVKVMFHWDRYAKADENSSCWVRVAQVWAGKQWGGMFIPRIGQEVIVEFLDGDPDRPIITGRVYNGTAKPPYALPGEATKSTIKSSSSKGGGGFNEIRLDDKKDAEHVFIHAQKDMHLRVKNDRLEIVLNNSHSIVKKDEHHKIGQDLHSMVIRDQTEDIGRDHSLTVGGDQAMRVDKTMSLKVKGDVAEVFESGHSETVTKKYYLCAEELCIEGKSNVTIKVGQSYVAIESGGIKIGTTGDIVLEATGKIDVKATADLSLQGLNATAKGTATLKAESPVTTVSSDAALTLKGATVAIN